MIDLNIPPHLRHFIYEMNNNGEICDNLASLESGPATFTVFPLLSGKLEEKDIGLSHSLEEWYWFVTIVRGRIFIHILINGIQELPGTLRTPLRVLGATKFRTTMRVSLEEYTQAITHGYPIKITNLSTTTTFSWQLPNLEGNLIGEPQKITKKRIVSEHCIFDRNHFLGIEWIWIKGGNVDLYGDEYKITPHLEIFLFENESLQNSTAQEYLKNFLC